MSFRPHKTLMIAWLVVALVLVMTFLSISKHWDNSNFQGASKSYGYELSQGWNPPPHTPRLTCDSLPTEGYTKGFPFTYRKGSSPCGVEGNNQMARILNIVSAILIASAVAYTASKIGNNLVRR